MLTKVEEAALVMFFFFRSGWACRSPVLLIHRSPEERTALRQAQGERFCGARSGRHGKGLEPRQPRPHRHIGNMARREPRARFRHPRDMRRRRPAAAAPDITLAMPGPFADTPRGDPKSVVLGT